jgi:hypothetical protein
MAFPSTIQPSIIQVPQAVPPSVFCLAVNRIALIQMILHRCIQIPVDVMSQRIPQIGIPSIRCISADKPDRHDLALKSNFPQNWVYMYAMSSGNPPGAQK